MITVGVGQLLAGLLLFTSGYILAGDGHGLLGLIDIILGAGLIWCGIDRNDPPSDGFLEAHQR